MARTFLFALVRRALGRACTSGSCFEPSRNPPEARRSRRRFLQESAGAALSLAGPAWASDAPRPRKDAPRIVIVGAGLAGLNAAYRLKSKGWSAEVYEAARRVGGRVHTAEDLLAPGLTAEVGGEFIDSTHREMRVLVRELELELLDLEAPGEAGLADTFFFGGREYREADIVKAFLPLAPRIRADQTKLGEVVTYRRPGNAAELDQTSLAAYLDRLGAAGWLRALVEAAFVGEFGLDADRQSALNLLLTISTDFKGGELKPFGDHDERYKVKGGNHRVAAALARRLDGHIRREHRLEALRSRGPGFRLTFAGPNGRAREVDADLVVLCLPFTLLRQVDLRVEMSPAKKKAIAELGYGTNAKLLAGFQTRFWRSGRKRSGEILTDEPLGIAWDNSRLQPGAVGGLTFFSGGRAGVEVGNGTAEEQVKRLLPGLEKVFPGAAREHNGKAGRFHWPSYPLARGSYPCYLPGQWTTLAGAEGEAVGHLFFAGDHCSRRFQGFMNGAAESGRRAAEALAAVVR